MRTILLVIATLALSNVSFGQVGTTAKEGAKATGEKAQQYGDQAKAAVSPQPHKAMDKAKARAHKAKAHHHAADAKDGAKEIPK